VYETRRAKFVAVSALTPDLLDTTGELDSFEGELEDAALDSLMHSYGQFDWGLDGNPTGPWEPGGPKASTFRAPVLAPDEFNLEPRLASEARFHQRAAERTSSRSTSDEVAARRASRKRLDAPSTQVPRGLQRPRALLARLRLRRELLRQF